MSLKIIFFEGLSNVGKSTLIGSLYRKMKSESKNVYIHSPCNDVDLYFLNDDSDVKLECTRKFQELKHLKDDLQMYFSVLKENEDDIDKDLMNKLSLDLNTFTPALNFNIMLNKLTQLETYIKLISYIHDFKEEDVYLLVDRTILSTFVYGYLSHDTNMCIMDFMEPKYVIIREIMNELEGFLGRFNSGNCNDKNTECALVYVNRDIVSETEPRDDNDLKFDKDSSKYKDAYSKKYSSLLKVIENSPKFIKLNNNSSIETHTIELSVYLNDAVNAKLST